MNKLIAAAAAALLIGLAAFTLLAPSATPAPAFTLTDLNGNTVNNGSLNGKVTLINFWYPECPGCVSEMPKLIKMAHDYRGRNFQILGIAVPFNSEESVREYVARNKMPFTVLYDRDKAATARFIKTELFPTSILLNQRGEILKTFVGEPDFAALYQEVDGELAK